ncbi:MAG TPA: pyruvate dehydrogenase (acetyl-transferring) E1 component subunit alpha [Phycisphaerae bacterium]|nr:pyruvate dehydrogenase (acetyl-transferring) E1 component subunit alpha [Phycisphaerae bacterium]
MTTISTPPSSPKVEPAPAQLMDWYRQMSLIRQFEVKCAQSYQQQKIGGFCHLYVGQEAVAVGSIAATRPTDYIITAYRDHGHAIARGMDIMPLFAELYGKAAGCSRGKGGSMHFFDKDKNFFGGHAIVAGHIPLAVGLGWAAKYRKQDRVTLCYFGDGAINQGSFHEALNLAGLHKLPCIFMVENNGYGMGTHVHRASAVTDLKLRTGDAYGIPGKEVDGMDCIAMYQMMKDALEYCRSGNGSLFLEVKTYRYRGHSMSDPQKYRTKEEVAKYQEHDPIGRLEKLLKEKKLIDDAKVTAINEEIHNLVEKASAEADAAPFPTSEDIWKDVYAEPFAPYVPRK